MGNYDIARCCDGDVREWNRLSDIFGEFLCGMTWADHHVFTIEHFERTQNALRAFGVDSHMLDHVVAQFLSGMAPEDLVGQPLVNG